MKKRKSTKLQVLCHSYNGFVKPDDFIVEEIPLKKKYERVGGKVVVGNHWQFIMEKKSITTFEALKKLSDKSGIPLKKFGYAGLKDKNAITKQWVSVIGNIMKLKKLRLKDIKLSCFRKGRRIRLGNLKGNNFEIRITQIKDMDKLERKINHIKQIPNYYGPQRFGAKFKNQLIGKSLLKRRLQLEKPLLKLLSHSYQSYLFNKTLERCIKEGLKPKEIPILGFNTKLGSTKIDKIIREILREEGVKLSEFKNPGTNRKAFVPVSVDYKKQNNSMFLNFFLPKGSYATVVLEILDVKKE